MCQRGWAASQALTLACLLRAAVVHDQMDIHILGYVRLDGALGETGTIGSTDNNTRRHWSVCNDALDLVKRALERIVDCHELLQVSKRQGDDQGRPRKDEFGAH